MIQQSPSEIRFRGELPSLAYSGSPTASRCWSDSPTTESTSALASTWRSLGYSKSQLGIVQTVFLLFSYVIPVISGSFADRFGFKKMLIVSYLAYLPSILLLLTDGDPSPGSP